MENQKKCSLDEHKDIDAILYCSDCKIYMCNKCENYHSPWYKNHHLYQLNKEEDIFTGYCQEKNHPNKLEYYCKQHNQLCCANCIAKVNKKGDGQHKDCNIICIEDIKEEKKEILIDNIKYLEKIENNLDESIKEFKEIIQQIEKEKDKLKLEIQKIFTKIRNIINDREDKLFSYIDNLYKEKYSNEEKFNKSEKIFKKLKLLIKKGKSTINEWDNNNINLNINDCINIENNILIINEIKEKINNYKKME